MLNEPGVRWAILEFQCSSASRKFLNQNIAAAPFTPSSEFQCSSASRKFLNYRQRRHLAARRALFQCSSASRKFLNNSTPRSRRCRLRCFSALQRAENSSIEIDYAHILPQPARFSALQRAENSSIDFATQRRALVAFVSVLFSEPKIPQCQRDCYIIPVLRAFQCSSASRKFLNRSGCLAARRALGFQCSSASRKFLNSSAATGTPR